MWIVNPKYRVYLSFFFFYAFQWNKNKKNENYFQVAGWGWLTARLRKSFAAEKEKSSANNNNGEEEHHYILLKIIHSNKYEFIEY